MAISIGAVKLTTLKKKIKKKKRIGNTGYYHNFNESSNNAMLYFKSSDS